MSPRWRDPAAFRADPAATPAERPTRSQAIALLAALVLVAGTVATVSYLVRPEKARAFDLFHGSLYLADQIAPVGVDLASGKSTTRLVGAYKQVGLSAGQSVAVVPLTNSTLLLNQTTGEFNMVDNGGFVVKREGGVPLGQRAGTSTSVGLASGDGQAYILRTGPAGGTDVYLVNQATVESAISATQSVTPRASTSMNGPVSTDSGGSVGADGDLWLLAGAANGSADGSQTIRQLSVPPNSSAGATLHPTDHGAVRGSAALGMAQSAGGPAVVGVLAASGLQLFTNRSTVKQLPIVAPGGLDRVLPASNQQGRLAFLLHGTDGWGLISVGSDGTGLRRVNTLATIPAAADLAPPADSDGGLYTIDRTSGRVYRIDASGTVTVLADYPLGQANGHTVEPAVFTDAYLIGRGSRVAVNSPSHVNALMLFTDGSRTPTVINKTAAVSLNAQGGAEALAATNVNPGTGPKTSTPGSAKPKPADQTLVNPRIDCNTVQQKPLIPTLNPPLPGSRSVQLSWTYNRLSSQDCFPSTYEVDVKLISNGAPQPPSSVQIQGQTGINLTGLFPSTQYEVTVTAFINGQGTASLPIRFTTGPEGPAAPTGVNVTADGAGNWVVTWNSCGGIAQGCVPVQDWTVTPTFCDSRGVSAQPPQITKTADPTARQQGPVTYPGSDSLLGRGLAFQVTGTGVQGQVGTPSATSLCVYSWAPPQISGGLSASQPANAALGGTTSATVTLNLGTDPARAVGGIGATITLALTNGADYTQSKPFTYDGSASSYSNLFAGLSPGTTYTATATVTAPGHGGSRTLGPVTVTPAANWPAMSLTASCPPGGLLSCDAKVAIHGLSSAQASQAKFDLVNTNTASSQIVCGNQSLDLTKFSPIDPAQPISAGSLSLLTTSQNCTATVVLQQAPGIGPPLFNPPTQTLTANFTLGQATTLDAKKSDFTAAWDASTPAAVIKYTGPYADGDVTTLTTGWSEVITGPDGSTCSKDPHLQVTHAGITVKADPACVGQQGGVTTGWQVTVSYQNADGSPGASYTYDLTGGPPGYQPCNPAGLTASWGKTRAEGVDVATTSTAKDIAGCSNWTYVINDASNTPVCSASSSNVTQAPPTNIPLTTCGTAPAAGWTLTISWVNTARQNQPPVNVPITGTPPTT